MLPYALKGAIDSQFYFINTLSRNQDADTKLIRKTNLEILRKNTSDTINRLKQEITNLNEASSSSVSTTQSLRDSVSTLESDLRVERDRTDSISFLGIDFQKSTYHTMVWVMIFVFAIAFIASFFAYKKSKIDTVEHQKTANELQDELQSFKKKSMEKEQLLKRQLLDEQLKRNS
ncbi:hypothetical protein M8998_08820 [Sphingobacterium sp. lm-10]|uniref:hypothetical protein n=1 Tax=Sphingobacterium sp. lm-10 TaxID=2944904 RepID=UPI00201FF702|nr:hypothetical protein [Sphingobacterium sp. lm-10]MCL7988039.1 hypothetical protein [Sphingobacterium sp. lm-10]